MPHAEPSNDAPTLARTAAGEDLRRGDFVAVLSVEQEWPSWLWCDGAPFEPRDEPVRIRVRDSGGEPLRVCDVCLPFVLVETARGRTRTLDVRACRLARIDPGYAKRARKALAGSRKRAKRR